MPDYKWATPIEWLYQQHLDLESPELRARVWAVLHKVDPDEIQEQFQDLMEEDGYFERLYDALIQEDEDEAKFDCGCAMKRHRVTPNAVEFRYCEAHGGVDWRAFQAAQAAAKETVQT